MLRPARQEQGRADRIRHLNVELTGILRRQHQQPTHRHLFGHTPVAPSLLQRMLLAPATLRESDPSGLEMTAPSAVTYTSRSSVGDHFALSTTFALGASRAGQNGTDCVPNRFHLQPGSRQTVTAQSRSTGRVVGRNQVALQELQAIAHRFAL